MTIQTTVLIKTLTVLGAKAPSRNTGCALTSPRLGAQWQPESSCGCGTDTTLLIHEGVKTEEEYKKSKKLPDSASTDNAEFQIVLTIIRDRLKTDPMKYTKMNERLVGVSEETTTGVKRLYQMHANGTLLFRAINSNDFVTKSKSDNLHGCRHSLSNGLMRATNVMIARKVAVVCGYKDVEKGRATAIKQVGAQDVISVANIFVTTTGNKDIIMVSHMKKMKNNAIVSTLATLTMKLTCSGRLMNLGCATRHPSFVMSCFFTNQVIVQLELWKEKIIGKYEKKVCVLPKRLDEKVVALHLGKLGSKLTKDQA
ncbi:hypothetical protein ACH5RR_031863 [Cinchona calisaya]|uniref:Adenosylhomocysteinase n=1 Tax=Cinchona calisaya TaxID=153742 RepID=A0ABD2YGG3_9GENT